MCRELAKFLALVAVVPNAATFLVMVVLFTLTRNESRTLTVIAGTISIQISFLVAFSQLIPAHTVTLFRGILSLRVPRFPLVYLGIIFLLSLTPVLTRAALWLAIFGFLTSWAYLRFYKTVFPGPVKPFVAAVADQIFLVLVAMRVCTPFSQGD